MSETPPGKPRHALSGSGPSVPAQGRPRDDRSGAGNAARPSVPEQQVAPADDRVAGTWPSGPGRAPGGWPASVPQPTRSGDDLFPGVDRPAAGHPAQADPPDESPTQALPVIPRPRDDRGGPGHPPAATVARRPEQFRPAAVPAVAAPLSPSSWSGGAGLPELPSSVRPVLPAVLGAAAALILTFGVVIGVNGGPDPVPAPPAPVSNP